MSNTEITAAGLIRDGIAVADQRISQVQDQVNQSEAYLSELRTRVEALTAVREGLVADLARLEQ